MKKYGLVPLVLLFALLVQCVSPVDINTPRSIDPSGIALKNQVAEFHMFGKFQRRKEFWPKFSIGEEQVLAHSCTVDTLADSTWFQIHVEYQRTIDSANYDRIEPLKITALSLTLRTYALDCYRQVTLFPDSIDVGNHAKITLNYMSSPNIIFEETLDTHTSNETPHFKLKKVYFSYIKHVVEERYIKMKLTMEIDEMFNGETVYTPYTAYCKITY